MTFHGACFYDPVNMRELGRYWADADSIGPVPAQLWHIPACLHGSSTCYSTCYMKLVGIFFIQKISKNSLNHFCVSWAC